MENPTRRQFLKLIGAGAVGAVLPLPTAKASRIYGQLISLTTTNTTIDISGSGDYIEVANIENIKAFERDFTIDFHPPALFPRSDRVFEWLNSQ